MKLPTLPAEVQGRLPVTNRGREACLIVVLCLHAFICAVGCINRSSVFSLRPQKADLH